MGTGGGGGGVVSNKHCLLTFLVCHIFSFNMKIFVFENIYCIFPKYLDKLA